MEENQLKPIEQQESQLKPITKEETKIEVKKDQPKQVITKLPDWSLEPPLEINRGN